MAVRGDDESWRTLDITHLSSGDVVTLRRRGDMFDIRFNGWELMSSANSRSEAMLGAAVESVLAPSRILVAGLGMGFTLRAVLDKAGPNCEVVVCELLSSVVQWNRAIIGQLAGRPLDDPRAVVAEGDAATFLQQTDGTFDVILFDTDNGPDWVMREENESIYSTTGLKLVVRRLRAGGFASYWSSGFSPGFEARLSRLAVPWCAGCIQIDEQTHDAFHVIYYVGRDSMPEGVPGMRWRRGG